MILRRISFCITFIFLSCEEDFERKALLHVVKVSPISLETAMVNVTIVDVPEEAQSKRGGICWSTSETPDTTQSHSSISLGGAKEYALKMTLLEKDRQYNVRPYIVTTRGELYYGKVEGYLNNQLPSLEETRLNEITAEYFSVQSVVKSMGSAGKILEYGHVWGTKTQPQIDSNAHSIHGVLEEPLAFVSSINQFTLATEYYVRPYAKLANSIVYGKEIVISIPAEIVPGKWQEIELLGPPYIPYLGLYYQSYMIYFTGRFEYGGASGWLPDVWATRSDVDQPFLVSYVPGNSLRRDIRGFVEGNFAYMGFGELVPEGFDEPPAGDPYQRDLLKLRLDTLEWTGLAPIPTMGRVAFFHYDGTNGWAGQLSNGSLLIYRYSLTTNKWTKVSTKAAFDLGISDTFDRTISTIVGENVYFMKSNGEELNVLNLKTMVLFKSAVTPAHHLFKYNNACYLISDRKVFRYDLPTRVLQKRNDYPADGLALPGGAFGVPLITCLNVDLDADNNIIVTSYATPDLPILGTTEKKFIVFKYSE